MRLTLDILWVQLRMFQLQVDFRRIGALKSYKRGLSLGSYHYKRVSE
jgi:hypothetical protein